MLRLARKRNKKFHIFKQDLTHTNFNNNSFDIILAIYSLPHIANLEKAFKEFSRLLKSNGLLLIASNFYELKNLNLINYQVDYMIGNLKLTGFIHTKNSYYDFAKRYNLSIKKFFTIKKAYGLKINPKYKYKKLLKIKTFGAVLSKI